MQIKGFSFKNKAILFDKTDFYFEDCHLNFILGEIGVGKSTILDFIADVDNNRSQRFIGFPNKEQIAYLSQKSHFCEELLGKDIIGFTQQLNNVRKFRMPESIRQLQDITFGEMSLAQRRRLLVFINTIVEKELYLFDEPENGIDLQHSQEIFEWFRELIELDKTVIITTHKLDNIQDTDNVNYIKNTQEILADSYLKIKSRMAF